MGLITEQKPVVSRGCGGRETQSTHASTRAYINNARAIYHGLRSDIFFSIFRIVFDLFDDLLDLIDTAAFGCLPIGPLGTVDAPEVAVFVGPLVPHVRVGRPRHVFYDDAVTLRGSGIETTPRRWRVSAQSRSQVKNQRKIPGTPRRTARAGHLDGRPLALALGQVDFKGVRKVALPADGAAHVVGHRLRPPRRGPGVRGRSRGLNRALLVCVC